MVGSFREGAQFSYRTMSRQATALSEVADAGVKRVRSDQVNQRIRIRGRIKVVPRPVEA